MNLSLYLTVLVLSVIGSSFLVSGENVKESLIDMLKSQQANHQHNQASYYKRVPFARSRQSVGKVKLPIKWGKRAATGDDDDVDLETVRHELFKHSSCMKVYAALSNANADVEKALEASKQQQHESSSEDLLKLYHNCLVSLLDYAYESEIGAAREQTDKSPLMYEDELDREILYEKRSRPFKWG